MKEEIKKEKPKEEPKPDPIAILKMQSQWMLSHIKNDKRN